MRNCTLLVSSCDKYEDAWLPYFTLLKKYWPEIVEYPIVLSTETKNFSSDGLNVVCCHNDHCSSWSERLRLCLNSISTEFVIISLEDFFLQKRVDDAEVSRCIKYMENDESIAVFYFKRVLNSYLDSEYENYYEATADLKYRLNVQMGVWRVSNLCDLLVDGENPWSFEITGSQRIVKSNLKFYCHKFSDIYHNIDGPFPYLLGMHNGYGIAQGKWMWNNKKLFRHNGVKVNMKRLGIVSKSVYNIGFKSRFLNLIAPPLVKIRNRIFPQNRIGE